MVAPAEWGPPTRVVPARFSGPNGTGTLTDKPIFIYSDVRVASDPACARITTVHGGARGRRGNSTWGAAAPQDADDLSMLPVADGDSDRVVWATHQSVDGASLHLSQLQRLLRIWEPGCISVGLWLCDDVGWLAAEELYASDPGLAARVTFHAAIGWARGSAPYPNAMRNVPLMPFAPWAPRPPGGGARPQPWVMIADSEAVPSVGEGVLRRWIAAAIQGQLAVPPSHVKEPPPEVVPVSTVPGIRVMWYTMVPENASNVAPSADAACDAWDGAPEPIRCAPGTTLPDARSWSRRTAAVDRAIRHSRCGKKLDPARTAFALPSFDVIAHADYPNGIIQRILSFPRGALPSRSHAYMVKDIMREDKVQMQANLYPPSYEAIVPWEAWFTLPRTAGVLAVHYSQLWEPYIIMRAPLPGARPRAGDTGAELAARNLGLNEETWQPYDEDFRCLHFDKCAMVADIAAAPPGSPMERFSLYVLPHVYLFNTHFGKAASDIASPDDLARKKDGFERFERAIESRGLKCRDLCPCTAAKEAAVEPPWGWIQWPKKTV